MIRLTIGERAFSARLHDNETAAALSALLPAAWDMRELNGNEKYVYLDASLPSAARDIGQIQAGDIMLYGDSCLVLFYDSFSTAYRYTPVGRIEDADALAEALGHGDVRVEFAPAP